MSFHRNNNLKQFLIRYISWPIEAVFLFFALLILRLIPIDIASASTGWLGSKIGPHTSWHKRANANLRRAMPELTEQKRLEILTGMWWNLGRNIGEFPHTLTLMNSPNRVKIEGLDKISACEQGSIIIGSHLANWEVVPTTLKRLNRKSGIVYRPLNNPVADFLIQKRQRYLNAAFFIKGREGAKGMLATIKENGIIALLIDQQLREGRMVPFFGVPVKTPVAHIKIAAKQQIKLFPLETIRIKGAYYKMIVHEPITVSKTASDDEIFAIALQINKLLESWIKERPEQWLWPHRRWGRIKG